MSNNLKKQLINRLRCEQEMFEDEIYEMKPREIIAHAYEITWRKQIIDLLSEDWVSLTMPLLSYFLNFDKKESVLNELYKEWTKDGSNPHQLIKDMLENTYQNEFGKVFD